MRSTVRKDGPSLARFNGIILAGERRKGSELLAKYHVKAKAFIELAGRPLILRVLDALIESGFIDRIVLCGNDLASFRKLPQIDRLLGKGNLIWVQNEKGPSMSAYKALKATGGSKPVLLTTSDHGLLQPRHVRYFCENALSSRADLVVGLARRKILEKYPHVKRTYYRFRNGQYCSCNLFGFMNTASFDTPFFWKNLEEQRKSPLRIISGFGWTWALRYLMGRLSLEQALERASFVLGCKLGYVLMPFAEAAIDVDSVEDLKLCEKILADSSK